MFFSLWPSLFSQEEEEEEEEEDLVVCITISKLHAVTW